MPRRFQAPYPPEFRKMALRLVRISRLAIPEVASELGINADLRI
jgi:transposase-like protein